VARTSDPHAATVKAWQTRARSGEGSGTSTQSRGDFGQSLRGSGGRATLEFAPVRPFNDPRPSAPLAHGRYDANQIEGHVAGFEVTTSERGLTDKVTPRTKALIEETLSKPEVVDAMREAGIAGIRLIPATNKHAAGMEGHILLLHPRTAEVLARSNVRERWEGGLERVIMHEAGHSMWNGASDPQRTAFRESLTPEHVAHVTRIVDLGARIAGTEFYPRTREDRATAEIHAETQAMRWYAPKLYQALPLSLRTATEDIWPRGN